MKRTPVEAQWAQLAVEFQASAPGQPALVLEGHGMVPVAGQQLVPELAMVPSPSVGAADAPLGLP